MPKPPKPEPVRVLAEAVETWAVDDLIPYARNAKKHPPEQVAQIVASMREFGFTVPVLVAEDGTIVAGHGRVLAAKEIGLGEVPVVVARGWSEAQRRAYTIADNKLSEGGEWDDDLLRIELGELREDGFEVDVIGFDAKELERILSFAGSAGRTAPDDTPEPEAVAVSRPGDVWVLGSHRIACGDCTDAETVARLLDGVTPPLMVTDPPYGVNYDPAWRARAGVNLNKGKLGKVLNDDRADWRDAWALFPGDVVYVWHSSLYTREVLGGLEACGFQHRAMIIWAKDRFTLGRGDYHWQHEPCWYAVRKGRKGRYVGGRSQSTLWTIPAREDGGFGHGTQKPVECMRRPIENNSQAGDVVYEPFSGSGTTIIAAEMTARRCFAIELNPIYVDVAVRRWEAFTGKKAALEAGGSSFVEAEAARASDPALVD